MTYIDYHQNLDLKQGVMSRVLRFRDEAGRVSRWEEKRIVSMHDQHLAALAVTVTPENVSGRLALRSSLDGSVINRGVERYRDLESRHLETLSTGHEDGGILSLVIPFHEEDIISQFEGYGDLEEFDWEAYGRRPRENKEDQAHEDRR